MLAIAGANIAIKITIKTSGVFRMEGITSQRIIWWHVGLFLAARGECPALPVPGLRLAYVAKQLTPTRLSSRRARRRRPELPVRPGRAERPRSLSLSRWRLQHR